MGAVKQENRSELISRLFAQAEKEGECIATVDPSLRKSLVVRMGRGEVVRPLRGMYARRSYWEGLSEEARALHVLRTAQRIHPDWVFCRQSAGIVYGLPIPFREMRTLHVATTREQRCRASRSAQFHVIPADENVRQVQGVRVVSPERAVFDCMRFASFGRALAIADSALRLEVAPRGRLLAFFREAGRYRVGKSRSMKTLLLADARSESAGESIARASMIERGFALPELQVSFARPLEPHRSYRVDFLWMREDGTRVIGEFDGRSKYEDPDMRAGRTALQVLEAERQRESQLSAYGMPILRLSYQDVLDARRFSRLLKSFGIPYRKEAESDHRRLMHSRRGTIATFSFCAV